MDLGDGGDVEADGRFDVAHPKWFGDAHPKWFDGAHSKG
jgi:hypothetical protein